MTKDHNIAIYYPTSKYLGHDLFVDSYPSIFDLIIFYLYNQAPGEDVRNYFEKLEIEVLNFIRISMKYGEMARTFMKNS
jgi:hypothetical protein